MFLRLFLIGICLIAASSITLSKPGTWYSSENDSLECPDTTINTPVSQNKSLTYYSETDYSIEIRDDSGKAIKLNDWEGKNLLIVYANTDCSYCKRLVKKLNNELKENPQVETIIIFSGYATQSTAKEFAGQTAIKYPYYFDYSFQFKNKYGAGVVPLTVFIKTDGTAERIRGLKEGLIEELINRINNI